MLALSISDIVKTALTLYHPFVGLVSWKYETPSSALYHSLSVAVMAHDIARLLAEDEEEALVAAYGGLVHDFYQKGVSVSPALTKEVGEKIIAKVLSEENVDKRVIGDVLQSANYNVAENPSIWGSKHPVASLSMWLADGIASSRTALEIYYTLRGRGVSKLTSEQQKLLEGVAVDVISLGMPQVALRSAMYSAIVARLRKGDSLVPIIAREGLVVLRRSSSDLPEISIREVLEELKKSEKIEQYIGNICRGRGKCRERLEPLKREVGELLCDDILETSVFATPGVKLSLSVGSCRGAQYSCLFCGQPVHDFAFHPGAVGYFLYGQTRVETWNPRLPAVSYGGTNLHALMQSGWKRRGVVACPLCVLDSFGMRVNFTRDQLTQAHYFIEFFFTLPTHYDLARGMVRIARETLRGQNTVMWDGILWGKEREGGRNIDAVLRSVYGGDTGEDSWAELLDATWTTHFIIAGPWIAEAGDVESFGFYLPRIAKAILFTGVYPVKFSKRPDPHVGDRLIEPTYPLYDYSVTDKNLRRITPLVVLTLSMIDELDDELVGVRGRLSREDRVRITLNYLRYPFELCKDLLVRRKEGRRLFEAYERFVENPLSLYG